jgi:hypothetical protein
MLNRLLCYYIYTRVESEDLVVKDRLYTEIGAYDKENRSSLRTVQRRGPVRRIWWQIATVVLETNFNFVSRET